MKASIKDGERPDRTRILVAEDSATQAELLRTLLEGHGLSVHWERNGRDALMAARRQPPALVISDIVMPEMDGYALCRAIKSDPRLKEVPVMLVTSMTSPTDVIEGLNCGADNFIAKPYDDRYLLARIEYLLANRMLRAASRLSASLNIEIGGKTYLITAEREQILDLLMSAYGEAARFSEEAREREASLREVNSTLEIMYRSAEALNQARSAPEVVAAALDACRALGFVHEARILLAADAGGASAPPQARPGTVGRHAVVPLVAGAATLGMLVLDRDDDGFAQQPELLSIFGAQIGAALARARQYEDLARDAAERTQQLHKLAANVPGIVYRRVKSRFGTISYPFAAGRLLDELGLTQGTDLDFVGLMPPDDADAFLRGLDDSSRTRSPAVLNFRITPPAGETRWIESRAQPTPLPDGSVLWDGVAFDVTGMHAARRREAHLRDQLAHAQKMEAIGNLTGGLAHDFNNILGIVIGNLDLLLDGGRDPGEREELAREALDAALRGAELNRRLLAFARRQPLQPTRIDVNALVENIVALLRRVLGEQVEIALDLAADTWPVLADPAQLESSLTNLATNARDAMPKGGRLTIATGNRQLDTDYAAMHADLEAGDYTMIEVTDTGTGMPADVASRIFDPFYTTKEQGKGTGLGLSMVFGFIKQSGGHINVYSEPGIGTSFRLYLPRAAVAGAAGTATDTGPTLAGAGERVLVVEDNPGLRRVAVRQLGELGYDVIEAETAAAALAALEEGQADLVFSDIVMPGGTDGFELAAEIARRWPKIGIVLTSGFSGSNHPRPVGGAGARLLSKPYRRQELAAALRAALDAAQPSPA